MKKLGLVVALMTLVSLKVLAMPIDYNFTASGLGGPVSSVTGSFTIDSNTLTYLSLDIGGYTFDESNSSYIDFSADAWGIGGDIGTPNSMSAGSYDFFLVVCLTCSIDVDFAYSLPGHLIYSTFDVELVQSDSDPSPVPEPTPISLLGFGLVALGAIRLRKHKAKLKSLLSYYILLICPFRGGS